ncbi:MAG: hypothetical protein E7219_04735 [Clostridiales bacterium]|nr:hypothetical protein [Clostridiales bacterium]
MNIEWWMIDGIIGLIILAAAVTGAARGIGDTVIRIAGIAGGIILGVFFSDKVSDFLMQTKMSESLHEHIFVILRGGDPAEAAEAANPAVDALESNSASYQESLSKSIGSLFDSAADRAADAAAIKLTEVAVSIIGFALILLAVAIAAAVIRTLIRSGRKRSIVLGFTDRTLGFALGAVRGLMLAWIAVALLIPLTTLFSPDNVPAMMGALKQTTLSKVLYDVNPFLLVVKYVFKA